MTKVAGLAASYPDHPELPCTLECGAIVLCNILTVHFELAPSGCAAENCGHWISLTEGLDLSCHKGFESRMGNNGRRH